MQYLGKESCGALLWGSSDALGLRHQWSLTPVSGVLVNPEGACPGKFKRMLWCCTWYGSQSR